MTLLKSERAEKLAAKTRFTFLSLMYQDNKDESLLEYLLESLKEQVFNDKIQQHIALLAVPVYGPLLGLLDE
jgi:ATP/maltotriose-dependent transcriptional regulator MalT